MNQRRLLQKKRCMRSTARPARTRLLIVNLRSTDTAKRSVTLNLVHKSIMNLLRRSLFLSAVLSAWGRLSKLRIILDNTAKGRRTWKSLLESGMNRTPGLCHNSSTAVVGLEGKTKLAGARPWAPPHVRAAPR